MYCIDKASNFTTKLPIFQAFCSWSSGLEHPGYSHYFPSHKRIIVFQHSRATVFNLAAIVVLQFLLKVVIWLFSPYQQFEMFENMWSVFFQLIIQCLADCCLSLVTNFFLSQGQSNWHKAYSSTSSVHTHVKSSLQLLRNMDLCRHMLQISV